MFKRILLLFVFLSTAVAAPAPRPKKPSYITRDRLIGTWKVQWGDTYSSIHQMTLVKDGFYVYRSGNDFTWFGFWSLSKNVLTITEWRESEYESKHLLMENPIPHIYEFDLSVSKRGTFYGYTKSRVYMELLERLE